MAIEANTGSSFNIVSLTLAQMLASTGVDGLIVYNSTYKQHFRYVNDRWWPFGGIDPRYGYLLEDEFISTGSLSQLDWNASGSGPQGNTGTYKGLFFIEQATASSVAYLMSYTAGMAFGAGDYYMEAMVQIPTLATVGEDFSAMFGANDKLTFDANSACTDGACFILNRAVNTTKWITSTTANGSNTATNTNTAVVAGTWYRLGILVSQTNANALFYVNGALVATHTTNIPSGASRSTGSGYKVDKTAGSAASDIYTDYYAEYGFFTTARVA